MKALLALVLLTPLVAACSTAEGEGQVHSDKLYVKDCWANAKFDLDPTFFGTNPFQDTQSIRIQRGDNQEEVSDGLNVLIDKVGQIRKSPGSEVKVGLPKGVTPPGVPVVFDPDPPIVHLALYLNDSCHQQNGTIYSISGTIIFHSLFSGDLNESNADDRYTDAEFHDVSFADPRQLTPGTTTVDPGKTSLVSGWFKFYFQRGQPAQPFQ